MGRGSAGRGLHAGLCGAELRGPFRSLNLSAWSRKLSILPKERVVLKGLPFKFLVSLDLKTGLADIENRLVDRVGDRERGMNRESSSEMYTLTYVK